jgi:thioredoxin reductase (NADPH)
VAAVAAGAEIALRRRRRQGNDIRGAIEHRDLVIVGSGPSGLTAAIYAARANLSPLVIAGYGSGGQLMLTSDVENFPGFPEGIAGPELVARMRKQAERFGAEFVDRDVDRVDLRRRPFTLWFGPREVRSNAIVFAMGAQARWLGLESEQRLVGRGVSSCGTCDGAFYRGKDVAVVGGGDAALEEALSLTRYARRVLLIHRREAFRASKIMQSRVFAAPSIEVHLQSEVEEVLGERHVEGIRVRDTRTGEVREVAVSATFVAIGHRPSSSILRGWLELDAEGYPIDSGPTGDGIAYGLTPIAGVFVAGDLHDHRYRQAVTAAGDGCKAAMDAERWLEEHRMVSPRAAAAVAS